MGADLTNDRRQAKRKEFILNRKAFGRF